MPKESADFLQGHYLKIAKAPEFGLKWVCSCGRATGAGPTIRGCVTDHRKHLAHVAISGDRDASR